MKKLTRISTQKKSPAKDSDSSLKKPLQGSKVTMNPRPKKEVKKTSKALVKSQKQPETHLQKTEIPPQVLLENPFAVLKDNLPPSCLLSLSNSLWSRTLSYLSFTELLFLRLVNKQFRTYTTLCWNHKLGLLHKQKSDLLSQYKSTETSEREKFEEAYPKLLTLEENLKKISKTISENKHTFHTLKGFTKPPMVFAQVIEVYSKLCGIVEKDSLAYLRRMAVSPPSYYGFSCEWTRDSSLASIDQYTLKKCSKLISMYNLCGHEEYLAKTFDAIGWLHQYALDIIKYCSMKYDLEKLGNFLQLRYKIEAIEDTEKKYEKIYEKCFKQYDLDHY
eukprot:TRINITY_DN6964_c0_g1_i1.p1 TRINITY_DN6964_c0_g1~~TRINITY_DN6964_c0_g1_i1.p1  ORF type:complete len:367 (-),score=18.62 TRINITY_DN6964_c0_g1_i1:160-1158(-)